MKQSNKFKTFRCTECNKKYCSTPFMLHYGVKDKKPFCKKCYQKLMRTI